MRRHRLIERFLTDVLGVPWDEVHEEAERLEHAMSPGARGAYARGDRRRQDLPARPSDRRRRALAGVPLADVEIGASVSILRFENEAEDLLRYLKASGIEPGLEGKLVEHDDEQVIVESADGSRCVLTPSVAETVSVTADPSPPPRTALPEQLVLGQTYGR